MTHTNPRRAKYFYYKGSLPIMLSQKALGNTLMNLQLPLAAILFFVILRPHPTAWGGVISVYWADAVLAGLLVVILLFRKRLCLPKQFYTVFFVGMIPMSFVWLVTIQSYGGGVPDIARFTFFAFLSVLIISEMAITRDAVQQGRSMLDIIFIIVAFITLLQLLDPPVFGKLVRQIYGDVKLRSIWTKSPRAYGSFYNANWFAVYLVFMISHWMGRLLGEILTNVKGIVAYLLMALFLLVISGSRTGLIGAVLAILISLCWSPWVKVNQAVKFSVGIFIICILVGVSLLVLDFDLILDKLLNRFVSFVELLYQGEGVSSYEERMDEWRKGVGLIQERPLVGYGIVPAGTMPHNSYVAMAIAMGIPSVLLFIGFGIFVVIYALATTNIMRRPQTIWFVSFAIAFAVMSFAAEYFFSSQLMLLWVLALAYAFFYTDNYDNSSKASSVITHKASLKPQIRV